MKNADRGDADRGDADRCGFGGSARIGATALCLVAGLISRAAGQAAGQNWPVYGGDNGATKYSALTDINRGNVSRLAPLWEWATGDSVMRDKGVRPGNFQVTPLAINDTLFLSTSYNRVVALDGNSGRLLWEYDPRAYDAGQVPNGTGFVHRGVATWTDGRSRRIFMNSRWRLIALDASTGKPIRGFGDTGVVDLTAEIGKSFDRRHYTQTSPPVVWRDLVIVGNGVADTLTYPNDPPGDVQAFDARTGKRVWSWSPIPRSASDPAAKTWESESWRTTGHTNVWAPFSVDDARGLVYLPVSTPSNDWYGGTRKGDNLYGESIVCLDARTGALKWYFQTVHHGLWDYDLPAAPVLGTVRVNGAARDIVAVPTKMGFLFVFDRVTGAPIWPIVERPVGVSNVPGEAASPTQPFPTKPAPFAAQGFGPADVVDFTPEIKALALQALAPYVTGPLFTPPSTQGTVINPGSIGGAGWGGGALDPTTGRVYIKVTNSPVVYRIVPVERRTPARDAPHVAQSVSVGVTLRDPADSTRQLPRLPINKPPYGTMVAIDLNTGEHAWNVTFGDTPSIRNHPALQTLGLPPVGVAGAPGPIVTAGGLLFATGGGSTLYALDSRDGATLWSADLRQSAYSVPMTYRTRAGKQVVVVAVGGGSGARLVAFAIP
jgi:quinoprotein glucose dehydrogenase